MSSVTSADDAPTRIQATVPLPGSVPSHSTSRAPGRIRGAALPQEYDLARFVENMEGLHPTWCTNVTACEWAGVKCNDKGEVTALDWTNPDHVPREHGARGSVAWKYLPLTLIELNLDNGDLTGEVEFRCLPQSLKICDLSSNCFFGKFDSRFLPPLIEHLYLNNNKFTGHINFTNLPPNLTVMWLEGNKFEGAIDLCRLPLSLRVLDISNNLFSGNLDFRHLPDSFDEFYAQDNNFDLLVNAECWVKETASCRLDNNPNLHGRVMQADFKKYCFNTINTMIEIV